MRRAVLMLDNWRLPAAASPNDSSKWPKARARKDLRQLGWGEALKQAPGVRFERASIAVRLHICRNTRLWSKAPGYRPRDEDNAQAALKGFFDGLVDARMFPDDNAKYVKQDGVTIYPVSRTEDEGLYVEIQELGQ
jgi:hypothetical protein